MEDHVEIKPVLKNERKGGHDDESEDLDGPPIPRGWALVRRIGVIVAVFVAAIFSMLALLRR